MPSHEAPATKAAIPYFANPCPSDIIPYQFEEPRTPHYFRQPSTYAKRQIRMAMRAEEESHRIQTYLETIETSVEPPAFPFKPALRSATFAMSNHFREYSDSPDQNRHARELDACTQNYGLFQVQGQLQVHPLRCRHRACPLCAAMRAQTWYRRTEKVLKHMTAAKHIVLTVKSNDLPLDDQLAHLVRSFRKLRQRLIWRTRTPWGYWTLEITRNETTGLWHPHIHALVNMAFLPFRDLRHAWTECTQGSFDCSIEAVSGNLAAYLSKYVSKTSTVFQAPVDPNKLYELLKGKRFVQPFGKFPHLPTDPAPDVWYIGPIRRIFAKADPQHPWWAALAEWLITYYPHECVSSLSVRGPRATDYTPLRDPFGDLGP